MCIVNCSFHFVRLLQLGRPRDLSKQRGEIGPAIMYSFTGAMDPRKKESAFLHLPTYSAGIIYHLGTFLSLALFILFLFKAEPHGWLRWLIIGFLIISCFSGLAILIKRVIKNELRSLSNPDDYISNLLVTVVQFFTAFALYNPLIFPVYFILVSVLLLYLPIGKLKHTIYFFAARYQLGVFYGWRGVWPPNKTK
jgi:nitrate reductase gamma subunit